MKLLYKFSENIKDKFGFIPGKLCYTKTDMCIVSKREIIILDNIISVEKYGNILTREGVVIRNNSEYICILAYYSYFESKNGRQYVIDSRRNTNEIYTVLNQYKHGVRNPIYD